MRVFFVSLISLLIIPNITLGTTYFVTFKYKKSVGYSISDPSKYLTAKSIERRSKQRITIDSTDLPVSRDYVAAVQSKVGKVLYTSKWLNGILVEATTEQANGLFTLDMVKDVDVAFVVLSSQVSQKLDDPYDFGNPGQSTGSVYGEAFEQVNLIKGQYLHSKKFKGKGITVAVIDAGFENYEGLSVLSGMRSNVVDSYDYIAKSNFLRASDAHGTKILSLLAGVNEGLFYGSAIDASYALYITESNQFEQKVEEYTWCLAAERADSIGVDIITSSLGYSKFDIASMNHTVADLSKNRVPVSVAAGLAAKKGILTVISAGNEGNKAWGVITFPADASDVISVGAVTNVGRLGIFSSVGLPNTTKPEVVCMGVATSLVDANGNIVKGNGTSYATPQIAGFAACLWEAFPKATALDIRTAILKSSSNYALPNNQIGYGIPDFEKAYLSLSQNYPTKDPVVSIGPNPFSTHFMIQTTTSFTGLGQYCIYDLQGRLLILGTLNFNRGVALLSDLGGLDSGLHLFKVIFEGVNVTTKIIKLAD